MNAGVNRYSGWRERETEGEKKRKEKWKSTRAIKIDYSDQRFEKKKDVCSKNEIGTTRWKSNQFGRRQQTSAPVKNPRRNSDPGHDTSQATWACVHTTYSKSSVDTQLLNIIAKQPQGNRSRRSRRRPGLSFGFFYPRTGDSSDGFLLVLLFFLPYNM